MGCLEQYAGADAMLRAAGLPVDSALDDQLVSAGAGERNAVEVLDGAGRALRLALSTAVNLLDVDTIVMGGSFAPLTENLRAQLERQLDRRVLWTTWAPITVRPALVTSGAALSGAALSVRSGVVEDPLAWIERRS